VKIAPSWTELRANVKDYVTDTGCQPLVSQAESAAGDYTLPGALSASNRAVKGAIGLRPTGSFAVKVVDGE
jgi:hypothetical protein